MIAWRSRDDGFCRFSRANPACLRKSTPSCGSGPAASGSTWNGSCKTAA